MLSPVFPVHGHEADPHPFAPTLAGMHFVYQIFVTSIFIISIWILSLQNQVGLKVALKLLAATQSFSRPGTGSPRINFVLQILVCFPLLSCVIELGWSPRDLLSGVALILLGVSATE